MRAERAIDPAGRDVLPGKPGNLAVEHIAFVHIGERLSGLCRFTRLRVGRFTRLRFGRLAGLRFGRLRRFRCGGRRGRVRRFTRFRGWSRVSGFGRLRRWCLGAFRRLGSRCFRRFAGLGRGVRRLRGGVRGRISRFRLFGCRCLGGIHQAVEPQVRFQTVILLNHRGEDNIPIRQLKRVVRPALIGRTQVRERNIVIEFEGL